MQRFRIDEYKISERKKHSYTGMIGAVVAIICDIFLLFDGSMTSSLGTLSILLFPVMLFLLPYNLRELLFINTIETYRNIIPADTEVNISELSETMGRSAEKITKQLKVLMSRGYIEGVFSAEDTVVTLYSGHTFIDYHNSEKTQDDTDAQLIVCKKCAAKNRIGAMFCCECGESLVKRCPRCRVQVSEDIMLCPECGEKLS